MPNKLIKELTAYTPPIDTDVMPIVDITTDTTKKITWANIKAALGIPDGWIAAGTFTYASATTITVASGAASIYQKGDKLKLTQTTVKYFSIITVADTLLTVTGGSDYTVENAAITSPFYSHIENPLGFPPEFGWGIVYSATGSMTYTSVTTSYAQFKIIGNLCHIRVSANGITGGTASYAVKFTPPVASEAGLYMEVPMWLYDGADLDGFASIEPTIVTIYKSSGNWGLGSGRIIYVDAWYPI